MVDSRFENVGTYGFYGSTQARHVFLNSGIKDATSHINRVIATDLILISGSAFENEHTSPHDALTIRPGGDYSRYALMKDNLFRKHGWIVQNGPQHQGSSGSLQYQLIEGNLISPYPGKPNAGNALLLDGLDYVIRNNIIQDVAYGISVGQRYLHAGYPKRWQIYENTMSSGTFVTYAAPEYEDIEVFDNTTP